MTPAERIALCESGQEPRLIAHLPSGYAVLAENQFLEGYCILLATPMVGKLNDLGLQARVQFLMDMAALGDAVISATGAVRANYGIYGNLDPFLHAHVWPRFANEPETQRTLPPLAMPVELRTDPATTFDPGCHADLMERIRDALGEL
jgi:diadenosine tetraphosphate (Ap4A) HIT family hydrolase